METSGRIASTPDTLEFTVDNVEKVSVLVKSFIGNDSSDTRSDHVIHKTCICRHHAMLGNRNLIYCV